MKSYLCPQCLRRVFDSDAPKGYTVKLVCPNRACPSRKRKPNSPPVTVSIPLGDRKP